MSYLKKSENWVYRFRLILRMKYPLLICCNPTVCFIIRLIKFNFCCNSMISQPLSNLKTQFSSKEEVGTYDNIALNQRYAEINQQRLFRLGTNSTLTFMGNLSRFYGRADLEQTPLFRLQDLGHTVMKLSCLESVDTNQFPSISGPSTTILLLLGPFPTLIQIQM